MKYGEPKAAGKTMRIREADAKYLESEGERRTRGNTDQLSHVVRLFRLVVEEVGDGLDDVDLIMTRIRAWKKKAGEGK